MAISEQEKEKVAAFFEEKKAAKKLTSVTLKEIDVLYPWTTAPAVLRVAGKKGTELWAVESLEAETKGVKVGTQDEYGVCRWEV